MTSKPWMLLQRLTNHLHTHSVRFKKLSNNVIGLTLSNKHLFSLMAPRQPRKPVTMTTEPRVMTRFAAEREGKDGENVAKLPWETDSQIPTPSNPQPDNWGAKEKETFMFKSKQKYIIYASNTHNCSVRQGLFSCFGFDRLVLQRARLWNQSVLTTHDEPFRH